MPAPPPAQPELEDLAERALALLDGEGQATAWWERGGGEGRLRVELLAVRDGRGAAAVATGLDEGSLREAAARALRDAPGGGPAELPEPAAGRAHEGYDPTCALTDPATLPDAAAGVTLAWAFSAAKVAIASSRGVRAYEQRSLAALEARAERDGRIVVLRAAAVGPSALAPEALAAEAIALLGEGAPEPPPAGEGPVVLGPDAVASVLDRARPAFAPGGALAARLGTRVAASTINLSDSPRFPATLPRAYDGFGRPRTPTPLIQDGVAHRLAAQPPTHLVLVGGGAQDLDELLAPLEAGLYVPVIEHGRTRGAFRIRDGGLAAPAADAPVELDPLEVLATTAALGARQRTLLVGPPSARVAGATVAPALRATRGVRIAVI
jgi:predicted Zn-dependent protease